MPAAPPPIGPRRIPIFAEALGYLGGALAVAGLVLVVAQFWPDLSTATQLAVTGLVGLVLVIAGAVVHAEADPALGRLRSFLWLASTAAAALFAGTAVAAGDTSTRSVLLAGAGAVTLESGLLWRWRDRPVQQLAFLGGLAVFTGALVGMFAPLGAVGVAVWLVGAIYLVGGLRRLVPMAVPTVGMGAATVTIGAVITSAASMTFGLPFVIVTAFGLLTLALVGELAPTPADAIVLGAVGGVTLLQAVPPALAYFSNDAAIATGLVTWIIGGVLVLIGARRVAKLPLLVEASGATALIGGAALTGLQSPTFATIFGIATALGLVALGMVPGQVVLSLFGCLGLLINVPWAIAWFFPGEGRVPVLILSCGALILAVAVFLARQGSRLRTGEPGHHRRPPSIGVA